MGGSYFLPLPLSAMAQHEHRKVLACNTCRGLAELSERWPGLSSRCWVHSGTGGRLSLPGSWSLAHCHPVCSVLSITTLPLGAPSKAEFNSSVICVSQQAAHPKQGDESGARAEPRAGGRLLCFRGCPHKKDLPQCKYGNICMAMLNLIAIYCAGVDKNLQT